MCLYFHCLEPVFPELLNDLLSFVYYEEIKRELKRILIYECRCNERLKSKALSVFRTLCVRLVLDVLSGKLFATSPSISIHHKVKVL
jgi:hypothetical protein